MYSFEINATCLSSRGHRSTQCSKVMSGFGLFCSPNSSCSYTYVGTTSALEVMTMVSAAGMRNLRVPNQRWLELLNLKYVDAVLSIDDVVPFGLKSFKYSADRALPTKSFCAAKSLQVSQ